MPRGWTGFHPPSMCVQSLAMSLLAAVGLWTELHPAVRAAVSMGDSLRATPPKAARAQGVQVMFRVPR